MTTEKFERKHFDKERMKKFKEKWDNMTDTEKLEFANKKVEKMTKDRFSVEAIDARCEAWMKKTAEEKAQFVKERKEAFEQHGVCMHKSHKFRKFDF